MNSSNHAVINIKPRGVLEHPEIRELYTPLQGKDCTCLENRLQNFMMILVHGGKLLQTYLLSQSD